jgi:hypothetical protein
MLNNLKLLMMILIVLTYQELSGSKTNNWIILRMTLKSYHTASRICVTAVEAGPPRLCIIARLASGTWFFPAWPLSWMTASTAW